VVVSSVQTVMSMKTIQRVVMTLNVILRKMLEDISRASDYLRCEDLKRKLRRLKWIKRYMIEAVQYAKTEESLKTA